MPARTITRPLSTVGAAMSSISPVLRGIIIQRDRQRCRHCRRHSAWLLFDPDARPWHIDHLIPRSGGGSDDPSNLALSCAKCNLRKGTRDAVPPPPPVKAAPREARRRGRVGALTIRVIAPIPGCRGRGTSGRLQIGRALYQAIGCPARIDLVRDEAGRLRIRPGRRYAINGPACDTIPRISIGQTALDTYGLTPGYHPARAFRGGIVISNVLSSGGEDHACKTTSG